MAFNLQKVLKVLLFASGTPLSIKDIQAAITRFHAQGQGTAPPLPPGEAPSDPSDPAGAGSEAGEPAEIPIEPAEDDELYRDVPSLITAVQIREAMDAIAAELKERDDGWLLFEGHQGYRLVAHPRFARWVRVLRNEPPPVRLSQSALETLAIVAYRQPVTRSEIESIRGVSADAGINKLLERELIRVTGRAELPGRPIQYGTTEAFLEFSGLKSLDELPSSDVLSPRQIDAWLESAAKPIQEGSREMGLPQEEEADTPAGDAVSDSGAIELPAEPIGRPAPPEESSGIA